MEKARNLNEFVEEVAGLIICGNIVYYDTDTLTYAGVRNDWLWDYESYLSLPETELERSLAESDLADWEKDLIREVRETVKLPHSVKGPSSHTQYKWRKEFLDEIENVSGMTDFVEEARKSLNMEHPFGEFKQAYIRHNRSAAWYDYQDQRFKDYVKEEIGIR